MIQSFKARLTLWTVAILAVALISFGSAMAYVFNAQTMADIDRELHDRARGPGGPFDPRRLSGPFHQGPGEDGQDGQNNPSAPDRPYRPGQFNRRDGTPDTFQRFADIRRPRHFSADSGDQDEPFDPAALKSALSGKERTSESTYRDIPVRVLSLPEIRDGKLVGAVQLARDLTDVRQSAQTLRWTLAWFIPLSLLLAGAGALLLASRATKPIETMRATAANINADHLDQRIEVKGRDELAQLGLNFNLMVDRLERSFTDLRQAYETQRRFTADASHELRTPLTRLKLALDSAPPEFQSQPSYKTALKSAETMTKLTQEMLVLAQADAGGMTYRKDKVDLRLVGSNAVNAVDPSESRVEVAFGGHPILVRGDADQLERVAINLLENALRYSDMGVRIRVTEDHGNALMEVIDHGPGIAPEHLPKLTERFYRVDQSRNRQDGGVGLGLAICDTIVKAHGGSITFESLVGKGTVAKIFLPFYESNNSQITLA